MRCLSVVGLLLTSMLAPGRDLYVSQSGSPSGSGTIEQPYDLVTALSGALAQPGDIFWLRGGNYALGHMATSIRGSPDNPVIFRQMPGERACVDGAISFHDTPGYVVLRDFELYSSDTNRVSSQTGVVTNIRLSGIASFSPNLSFINLVVHDHIGHGFYISDTSSNNLVYGCIVYNNGWMSADDGGGHGVQARGAIGALEIAENIVFNNSGAGMHVYEDAPGLRLTGVTLEGNVVFNASGIQNLRPYRDWIVGVDLPAVSANGILLRNNMGYYAQGSSAFDEVQIGRQGFNGSVALVDNYLPQGLSVNNWSNALVTGNLFAGQATYLVNLEQAHASPETVWDYNTYWRGGSSKNFVRNAAEYDFSGWQTATGYDEHSSYSAGTPRGTRIFVRPNRYEEGRAHVVVYNWDHLDTVRVDVGSVISAGTGYEVRNAQDFFAAPVLSGVFDGQPLELPMRGLTVAAPNGPMLTPRPTGPTFNAFVLLPRELLRIAAVNGRAEISWRTNSGPWVLQFSETLLGNEDWMNVTSTPAVREDRYVVTELVSVRARFYRLKRGQ